MSVCALFFATNVDCDNAGESTCDGQGDEIYPTEFYVLEGVHCGKDEEGEEHIDKSCHCAFQDAVLLCLESNEAPDEDRDEFYHDIDGDYNYGRQRRELQDDCKHQYERKRYERRNKNCFQNVKDIGFHINFFHSKVYFCREKL